MRKITESCEKCYLLVADIIGAERFVLYEIASLLTSTAGDISEKLFAQNIKRSFGS